MLHLSLCRCLQVTAWCRMGAVFLKPNPQNLAAISSVGALDPNSSRKVDGRLHGKGNSNSHGARPVLPIITMINRIRTRRLSTKNSLSSDSWRGGTTERSPHSLGPLASALILAELVNFGGTWAVGRCVAPSDSTPW
jgi:hypothetical protein